MNDPANAQPTLGTCPFCEQGEVRVRKCSDQCAGVHFFALCDECEAIWLKPDLQAERIFPDAENATCPICNADLFGSQARWATKQELHGTSWSEATSG